jgi:hypothetical protein
MPKNSPIVASLLVLIIAFTFGYDLQSFTPTREVAQVINSALYPNRPASYTQTSEINFSQTPLQNPPTDDSRDQPIAGTDWNMIYFGTNWTQLSDSTAPQSPPGVWQGHWAPGSYGGGVIGQGGGHGIGNVFTYAPSGTSKLYMSMRLYFDFDASQWHPISNKFVNIETDAGLILVQLDEGGNWRHAEELSAAGDFGVDNNRNSPTSIAGQVDNRPVPNRQWTQLEVLIDIPNHIFKVWQDGVLTTDATPTFKATKITTVGINAFRGGGGETLTTDLYYRYDDFFIAWEPLNGTTPPSNPPPSTPPPSTPAPLAITSISPTSGPVGTTVTITGTSLDQTTSIRFNQGGVPTYSIDSPTQITTTVPSGSQTGSISLNFGQAVSSQQFVVTSSPNPPAPAPTVLISANPTSLTQGQSTTISWSSANTTSCSASWTPSTALSASQAVTPSVTTTYSITCTGSGGSDTESTTVTVNPPVTPPTTPSNQLPKGNFDGLESDGVTLYGWSYDPDTSSVSNQVQIYVGGPKGIGTPLATLTANLSRSDVDALYGITGNHGFEFSVPATLQDGLSHTYYVYGLDTSNSSLIAQLGNALPITVTSPTAPAPPSLPPSDPTLVLTANPTTITAGQRTTITWGSTNTDSCTASGGWSGTPLSTSGSLSFAPLLTTSYALTCTGGSGNPVTKSVTVTVSTSSSTPHPVTPPTTPPVTHPSSTIGIGSSVTTTANLNVRLQATANSRKLGTQHAGAKGVIKNGPVKAQGYTWWSVDFTYGADGWVAGQYLKAN